MGRLLGALEVRQLYRFAALGRDAKQVTVVRTEDDGAALIPCTAKTLRRVGQVFRRSAGDVESFELAAPEKSQGFAIRRPEWELRIVGSRQRPCRPRVQSANPELRALIQLGYVYDL